MEAFSLPSSASRTLSRSHTGHCSFWFTNATIVQSHTPSLARDSWSFDILALKGVGGRSTRSKSEMGILRLFLLSDGTISSDMSNTQEFDFSVWNLSATSSFGVSRAIAFTLSFDQTRISVCGYTVARDFESSGFISSAPLHIDSPDFIAFDGHRGRLCFNSSHPRSIEIHDYV